MVLTIYKIGVDINFVSLMTNETIPIMRILQQTHSDGWHAIESFLIDYDFNLVPLEL